MFNSNWHSHMIFLVTLSWGIMVALTANSVLMMWIGMEINLIAFIPLVMDEKSNMSATNVMKYFLIQVIASFAILYAALLSYDEQMYSVMVSMMCLGLMVKMGLPPYHFWLPPMMNAMSWLNCFYLSSAQKLIPLMIMMNLKMVSSIIFFMLILTLLVSSIGGLSQTNWRPLMAYSSMSHMVWIISASQINPYTTLLYLIVYFSSIMVVFMMMNKSKLTSVKDTMKSKTSKTVTVLICLMTLSMAGLPPLVGFAPKLMVLTQLTSNLTMAWALLSSSAVNLWFYLNLSFNTIMHPAIKTNTEVVAPTSMMILAMLTLTVLVLMV